jgi:hypothetical protein
LSTVEVAVGAAAFVELAFVEVTVTVDVLACCWGAPQPLIVRMARAATII